MAAPVKKISTTFAILLCVFTQQLTAQHVYGTYDVKQPPRGNITPYHSRQTAIAGDPAESRWVLREYEPWQSEETGEYVRMTTRYKVPRAWSGRSVIFRVEDVPLPFMVELNGAPAGYAQAGMGRTEFDLTSLLQPDYNEITVVIYKNAATEAIENHRPHDKPAFRDACMIATPRIRINDIVAATAVEEDGRGTLALAVAMKSSMRNPYEYLVSYELLSPAGDVVASGYRDLTTDWFSEDTLRYAVTLRDVKPWNHETPNLYTLVVRSFHEGRNVEFVARKIGFRSVSYRDGALMVNGRPTKLTNFPMGYMGNDESTEAELRKLKKASINGVTVPGYPQPDAFYDICDRLGMYVCDVADVDTGKQSREITVGGNPSNDPEWAGAYVERAVAAYRHSQLHPSVVLYSPARNALNGYCLYESYNALKALEKSRPIHYPHAGGQWNSDRIDFVSAVKAGEIITAGSAAGEGASISVTNAYELTQVEGYAVYAIKQRGRIKAVGSEPVKIAPGLSAVIELSAEKVAEAAGASSVEVFVYTPDNVWDNAEGPGAEHKAPDWSKIKDNGLPSLAGMTVVSATEFSLEK